MGENTFNEPEKYLIQNWVQARRVEKSMEDIRDKYAGVFDRVRDEVKAAHHEFDDFYIRVTQFWCKGIMGIGRKEWRRKGGDQARIQIDKLRLEALLNDDLNPPFAGIWACKAIRPGTDLEGVAKIISEAKKVLTKEECARCRTESEKNYGYVLRYDLPENRHDLAEMLLEGDGQKFVDCMVSHFDVLARFIPVLDEVFTKPIKLE
jgi:hypothetical protein